MDSAIIFILPQRQQGAVLFMALMFLVLSALIAITLMDTSILLRKMAANSQFQEEAMQVTEGLANEIANTVMLLLERESVDQVGEQAGELLCMVNGATPVCTLANKPIALSREMQQAAGNDVVYRAHFSQQNTARAGATRMAEDEVSEGLMIRHVEVEVSYDGVDKGLSRASLAIGVINKSLLPGDKAKNTVQADAGGSGSGTYHAFY